MVDLSNLRVTDIFTRTGQPLSEVIGIRPEVTLAELARPDANFAELARPFRPGDLDISVRPGLIDPGDIIGPRVPPGDREPPATSWPTVGIPSDVSPGDLIQAAAWNTLLAWVRALAINASRPASTQPTIPTAPPTGGVTGIRPLPIDPGLITQLQPIPQPPILERPPIESLLGHPEIVKTIASNPSILDLIVKAPEIGDTLVAHPEILTNIVSTPLVTQPVVAQPVLAQPVTAQPVTAQPVVAQPVSALPLNTIVGTIATQPTLDTATVVERLSADPLMGRVLESQPALRTALGIAAVDTTDATRVADQPVAPTSTTRTRTRTTRTSQPG